MAAVNMAGLAIVAFLFGVVTALLAKPRKKHNGESIGSLVIDMSEPYDPGLYLSIESDDVIYDVVKNDAKTVTLNVIIHGE